MKSFLFIFLISIASLFASDAVVELLVTDSDNHLWQTKNQMHMTIGHIKNVDANKITQAIEVFNRDNRDLLQKSVSLGFEVECFNINGFNNGYHILEANPETTARFDLINSRLYTFLIDQGLGTLTDKTTPKTINPKGYTPHIEFLETNPQKIPVSGDVIHFKGWQLQCRIVNNS